MFAPGGLDFDGIDGPTNTSSEDEYNKEQLSNRSDHSNTSTESTSSLNYSQKISMRKGSLFQSSILENESEVNSSSIKQKEMVMSEIRRKAFSSDSERENDLNDAIDGLEFGRTPPRESRRNKQKFKCVKFNNQLSMQQTGFNSVKKPSKKNSKNNQANVSSGNFPDHWQRQRSEERREKQIDKVKIQTRENTDDVPRSTKLVRVNSSKCLKSISQQKTANAFSRPLDFHNSKKFLSSAMKFVTAKRDLKSKGSSRQHFFKSFSLLVNLGGKLPYHHHQNSVDVEEEDNFQVGICSQLYYDSF